VNDSELKDRLKEAFGAQHRQEAPAFDKVWAAAGMQHDEARRLYATFTGIAATLAIVAVVAALWSSEESAVSDEYLIADSLLNATQWSAPSDALMPQHEFDIYREVPFPMESTNTDEGSLL
jgi:hypothetical protein